MLRVRRTKAVFCRSESLADAPDDECTELVASGRHGSSRKGYRCVRGPCARPLRACAVLIAAQSRVIDGDVCCSTRWRGGRPRATPGRNIARAPRLPRSVCRLFFSSHLHPRSVLVITMSRIGRPPHLAVSVLSSSGFFQLSPTHARLGTLDGAYRHRASKRECCTSGGSGFVFGGIDGEPEL